MRTPFRVLPAAAKCEAGLQRIVRLPRQHRLQRIQHRPPRGVASLLRMHAHLSSQMSRITFPLWSRGREGRAISTLHPTHALNQGRTAVAGMGLQILKNLLGDRNIHEAWASI